MRDTVRARGAEAPNVKPMIIADILPSTQDFPDQRIGAQARLGLGAA
jgi:hypothetical protein